MTLDQVMIAVKYLKPSELRVLEDWVQNLILEYENIQATPEMATHVERMKTNEKTGQADWINNPEVIDNLLRGTYKKGGAS